MQAHDETRTSFEAAVVERLRESGFLEIEIRTECLARVDDGYQDEVINAGWHYWQAAIGAKREEPRVYVVGDKTMDHVFKPSDLTNLSDMQAVLDAVEAAFSGAIPIALADAMAERKRQVDAEGWIAQHDDQYVNDELVLAAICYLSGNAKGWPWSQKWWKPTSRRRDLVKAAALIISEIERLDRALIDDTHIEACPVCNTPLKPDDICANDIELGICHAECLNGSPVVDLDTGEETGGEITTFRYGVVK